MMGSSVWMWVGLAVIALGVLLYSRLGPRAAASLDDQVSAAAPTAAAAAASSHRDAVAQGGVLLDVRTPGEFRAKHLEGATNIPLDSLASRLGELTPGQDVVVYCHSGRRSGLARPILERAGHRVIDIGTMARW